jgi:hypothetical protein
MSRAQMARGASSMNLRFMWIFLACLAMSPPARADEQPGLLHRMSCSVIRFYIAKYSAAVAEQWARSKGASDAEIEAARRCLTPDTRTAKTGFHPVATSPAGS